MIAWLDRLRSTEGGRIWFERVSPWFVISLAAFLRLINLGNPPKLVFDETYYVKDAWTLWNTGAERAWPGDYNSKFESGAVNGFLDAPSFVVHPPLGKWLIGLGMWLGGAENAWSWRIAVALCGTATVGLVFLVGKRIFRSHNWGLIAAFFMAIEGQAIVMSRVALLDGILGFFVLLGFWFLLKDREWISTRIAQRTSWARPWLVAMGLALGCATAVKWSGIYFIAVFGLYAFGAELLDRRRSNLAREEGAEPQRWISASLIQGAIDFVLLVPIALAVYVTSWTGWFISKTGYGYTANENPLLALLKYHQDAYSFHVGLRVPHSYQANPLTWLFMQRPTSMFYEGFDEGKNGCNLPSGCASAIDPVPNPLVWYAAVALARLPLAARARAHPGPDLARHRRRLPALDAVSQSHGLRVLHDRLRAVVDARACLWPAPLAQLAAAGAQACCSAQDRVLRNRRFCPHALLLADLDRHHGSALVLADSHVAAQLDLAV